MASSMRDTGNVAIYEWESLSGYNCTLHGAEWWNGEGIDFDLNDHQRFHLSMEDIEAVAVIAHAFGMIELKEIEKRSKELIESMHKQKNSIAEIRAKYEAGYL